MRVKYKFKSGKIIDIRYDEMANIGGEETEGVWRTTSNGLPYFINTATQEVECGANGHLKNITVNNPKEQEQVEKYRSKFIGSGIDKKYRCSEKQYTKSVDKYLKGISKAIAKAPDTKVKSLVMQFVPTIKTNNNESPAGIENNRSPNNFDVNNKTININPAETIKGNDYNMPFQKFFHENGHFLDNILGTATQNGNSFASGYKNNLLAKTIKEDVAKLVPTISQDEALKYGMTKSQAIKIIDDSIRKGNTTDGTTVLKALPENSVITINKPNGVVVQYTKTNDGYIGSAGNKVGTGLIKNQLLKGNGEITDLHINGQFTFDKINQNVLSKETRYNLEQEKSQHIANTTEMLKSVKLGNMIMKLPSKEQGILSDICGGAIKHIVGTVGHTSSYWNDTKLSAEAFAHFISASMSNQKEMERVKSMLPNTVKVFDEMIEYAHKIVDK